MCGYLCCYLLSHENTSCKQRFLKKQQQTNPYTSSPSASWKEPHPPVTALCSSHTVEADLCTAHDHYQM